MRTRSPILIIALGALMMLPAIGVLAEPAPPAAAPSDGKYADSSGNPTYRIQSGEVDWYTFSGYRRFNGNCETCHGFDGSGSSFAPDLTQSLKSIDYAQFIDIVVNGKGDVSSSQNLVMPAFGTNKNVMCYLDDIYVYLKARSDGALGRGRPEKNAPKPEPAKLAEDACMGP